MTTSDIEDFLDRHPAGPYQLTLSSGDKVYMRTRYQIVVMRGSLALGVYESSERDRLTMVSTPNVAMIKVVDQLPPGETPRRRKRQ